jgi:hypothetical protein
MKSFFSPQDVAFRRADANRNFPISFFFLGAALARLGRDDEARDAVKAGLAIHFWIWRMMRGSPAAADPPEEPPVE